MPEAPEGAEPSERGGVFANRSYRHLFAAAFISNYGSMLNGTALPFVAIAALDATPADIGRPGVGSVAPIEPREDPVDQAGRDEVERSHQ